MKIERKKQNNEMKEEEERDKIREERGDRDRDWKQIQRGPRQT